ncbi:hypothetical protein BXZ70DRAFT_547247 [Cristinia sonorae]|uniref:HMG box domain-containing protein n=1 Tax=Cristinia sonorae TaxID=1940300 RepID=A0A8K0XL13_9AGAR|nr:hypothetical protein BXZ70DRAFT_547247 [Cristinia sonorae]
MPAVRNPELVRRSRRLNNLPPRSELTKDGYEWQDVQLLLAREATSLRSSVDSCEPPSPFIPSNTRSSPPSPTAAWPAAFTTSHARKKHLDHIPRPPNAFLCFRSEFWAREKNKAGVERDHRQISRLAGIYWTQLTKEEKAPYHRMAALAKIRHAETYPQYRYTPMSRKEKTPRKKTSRAVVVTTAVSETTTIKEEVASPVLAAGFEETTQPIVQSKPQPEVDVNAFFEDAACYPVRARPRKTKRSYKAHKARRARTSSPVSPVQRMPELTFPEQHEHEYCIEPNEPFVPTSQIPPLTLNAPLLVHEPPKPLPVLQHALQERYYSPPEFGYDHHISYYNATYDDAPIPRAEDEFLEASYISFNAERELFGHLPPSSPSSSALWSPEPISPVIFQNPEPFKVEPSNHTRELGQPISPCTIPIRDNHGYPDEYPLWSGAGDVTFSDWVEMMDDEA